MIDNDRDKIDDLFRSKLYDFETETMPDDWDLIASRLSATKARPVRRALHYWTAAAAISLLVISGAVYWFKSAKDAAVIVQTIQEKTEVIEQSIQSGTNLSSAFIHQEEAAVTSSAPVKADKPVVAALHTRQSVERFVHAPSASEILEEQIGDEITEDIESIDIAEKEELENYSAEIEVETVSASFQNIKKEKAEAEAEVSGKRWGFGMGAGGVTTGSSNSLNTYAFKNTSLEDVTLMQYNSPYFNEQAAKTNIKHKMPFSFGMGVSYKLTERLALQSGLNYSYLTSSWETNGAYYGKTKQKLHYIGIPLSLNYTIAQWHNVQWYASAGAMAEINVAGKLDTKLYKGEDILAHETERVRMKELLWSVNAKTGLSYPLIRFLSVYAEAGVGYYFDNGSDMETIRSEKPFNVNLQAGFRLGF